jgi:hypothetical protein
VARDFHDSVVNVCRLIAEEWANDNLQLAEQSCLRLWERIDALDYAFIDVEVDR